MKELDEVTVAAHSLARMLEKIAEKNEKSVCPDILLWLEESSWQCRKLSNDAQEVKYFGG